MGIAHEIEQRERISSLSPLPCTITPHTPHTHIILYTQHDFTTDDCIQLATERASFQFMKEHGDQFDEKLSKRARNEACGLDKNAGIGTSSKINAGQSGSGAVALSEELKSEIEAKWKEVVEPVTGCSTYKELRASFQN